MHDLNKDRGRIKRIAEEFSTKTAITLLPCTTKVSSPFDELLPHSNLCVHIKIMACGVMLYKTFKMFIKWKVQRFLILSLPIERCMAVINGYILPTY